MANLSNINNKFLVTTTGEILVGRTAATGTSKLQVSGSLLIGTDINSGIPLVVQETTADGFAIGFMRNTNTTNGNGLVIDVNSTGGAYIQDWRQASTVKMRLLQNGNLGIGDTTPSFPLVVSKSSSNTTNSGDGSMRLALSNPDQTNNNSALITFNDGTSQPGSGFMGMQFTDHTNNYGELVFGTRGAGGYGERMRINSSGDVLMGNTVVNPASNFSNQKGFGYKFSTGQTEIATTSDVDTLTLGRNIASDGNILVLRKEATVIGVFGSNTAGGDPLLDIASAPGENSLMRFLTSGTERMRIDNSGNVGIGVTPFPANLTPQTVLDIGNAASVWGYQNYAYFIANAYYNAGWLYKNTASAGALQIAGDELSFRQAPSGTANAGIAFTQPFTIKASGNVGIGITSPNTTLHVDAGQNSGNLTNNVAVYIGGGFVGNDLYHRQGGFLVISGTNATQTSAGIAFQTRNTGNTNYWKSSILMNRGGELEFYTGGAGTGQGSERMKITSGGNIQIPTDSASLQLRSSGSGAYTSIRRDAANQLIVANTANNQVFGIGNGGELAITNGASYTTTLTYTTGWNSSYQTLIPGNSLSPNAVYIVTIKCDSFGTPPYYASTVFHIATSPGTNGSGGGNDNIAPTATHVNSTVYWKYRLSTIVNGKNGVEAYLSGGPTPNGTTIYVKATKIMTM